jgi:DNA-binding NtrC family response regulator
MGRILIIDDDRSICELLGHILENDRHQADAAFTGAEALKAAADGDYDLFLLDMQLPDVTGLEMISSLAELRPETPVIIITGHASIEDAVKAVKAGVYDYLQKPLHADQVLMAVNQALERKKLLEENRYLKETLNEKYGFDTILTKNKAMLSIFATIRKVADTRATVLITGESGTGKELVARAVHFNSGRRNARFVPINCGGIPETLLESELFGYVRGAFTGAVGSKPGLFKSADRGTIFLDEIASMPQSLQVKLLRVLQEGTYYPLGSVTPVEIDVRVVAASNQNLEEAVKAGTFREDLYYRLNVIHILIPPLRERKEDIPNLAQHFSEKYAKEHGKAIKGLEPAAQEQLMRHSWPGNVRELENAVEHAVAVCAGQTLTARDFPERRSHAASGGGGSMIHQTLHQARDEFEKQYIQALLEATGGNITKAAVMAGIARQNLQLKIKESGINPKAYALNREKP